MQAFIALAGLPVALWLTTTGLGLLAERLARARIANGLLAPLGFCVATALLGVYELGGDGTVAAAILVAGVLAGLVLARTELPARLNPGWPGLAGLGIYLLYAAPVLLTGNWTWSGYNFLNDTAVQFLLIDQLHNAGTQVATVPPTTASETLRVYFSSGYPIGTHAVAATLSTLLHSGPEVIYQAFIASMAALASMALAVVAGRTLFGARTAALVGAAALASNLVYNTGLQGSIKEIGIVAALATAAALAREVVRSPDPVPVAALLGIALAAMLAVYSAAGLPYVAALLATLATVVLLVHGRTAFRRRWLTATAAAGAVAVVLAAPVLTSVAQFYRIASATVDAVAPAGDVLGQLGGPLPLLQAGGIWLDGAYQTPIHPSLTAESLTNAGLWFIAGLALLALVEVGRRRCPEALLVLVPAALTAALVAPGVVPYADAKLLAIMSPSVVFAAAIGLSAIGRIVKPIGTALAVVFASGLGAAIALSDAFALHDSKIAPRERMVALRDAVDRAAGRGPVLFTEAEEFAKHFGSGATLNVSGEPITPRQVQLRAGRSHLGQYFDLDEQQLDYVTSFASIVQRRSPSASRPPASYRRIYTNEFYEVWRRGSGARPVAHLPLQRPNDATAVAACADVRALARRARRSSGALALVAARAPADVRLDVLEADRTPLLAVDLGGTPGTLSTLYPGTVRGRVRVTRSGAYRLWLRGTFARATHVLIDGRRRATLQGTNTPGQWLGDVPVRLVAGVHRVEIRIPDGSPKPGDGGIVTVGPLAFVADEPGRLETMPVARWRSLCGRELDWIELVRQRGVSGVGAPGVTVAIPVRNGGPRLAAVLAAVGAQRTRRVVELLVCDSGSTDGSLAVARDAGARVVEIEPASFSHGGTRNFLMQEARGQHVVFLTQDAVPASDAWLDALLAGFEAADGVGLVYGPYLPQPDASPMVRRELSAWFASFGDVPRVDRLDPGERDRPAIELLGRRAFFTDANGAVARAAWERVPFRAVAYAEDHQLALDMLRAGFAKVYVPGAAVEHSHDYPPARLFRRCFDEWRGLREIYGWVEPLGARAVRDKVLIPARADVRALRAEGAAPAALAALAGRATAHHAIRLAGAVAGSRAERLPPRLRARLSLERRGTFAG